MSNEKLRDNLENVAAGVLTPFDEDDPERILYEEIEETVTWLSASGIEVFLACANISEFDSLSVDERIESVRVICKTLNEDETVIAGAGGSLKMTKELAIAHEENGADGIMIMPPRHDFKHEVGVAKYYQEIAKAVDIGVIPYLRGFNVTPRLVERITHSENVVGIKWAIPDIELFSECVNRGANDTVWICGMGEPPAPAYYFEGATGFSAGVSNFVPEVGLAMFDALENGESERARQLRNLCQPIMNLRSEKGKENIYPGANSIPVVKEGLRLAGRSPGTVRTPLVELEDSESDRVRNAYAELKNGLDRLEVDITTIPT